LWESNHVITQQSVSINGRQVIIIEHGCHYRVAVRPGAPVFTRRGKLIKPPAIYTDVSADCCRDAIAKADDPKTPKQYLRLDGEESQLIAGA
jgi:hypothetical protein